ncbi:hypothetical protein KSX_86950 [Ktedonospora formicarum]|uniref:Uncharacterized protein n=1 Tax=Ktedonospora formicarum TaxID=2778364 RepID=A0A8J3MVP0_9CHLR|nr:hypothetical protein KSX_86950 [Ktedonospora formicarum]
MRVKTTQSERFLHCILGLPQSLNEGKAVFSQFGPLMKLAHMASLRICLSNDAKVYRKED